MHAEFYESGYIEAVGRGYCSASRNDMQGRKASGVSGTCAVAPAGDAGTNRATLPWRASFISQYSLGALGHVFLVAVILLSGALERSARASLIQGGSFDPTPDSVPEVARFLSGYVQVASVSGNEGPAGRYFAEECSRRGLQVRVLTDLGHSYNFVASLYPLEQGKPNIILLNHIDVVDTGDPGNWTHPPYSGAIVDGAVWGRGAIDNKGMAAMQLAGIMPFIDLAREHDLPFNVSILAVSGEEVGGKTGAAVVTERFLDLLHPVVVLGEGGTGMDGILRSDPEKVLYGISINHKRMLWLRLSLKMSSPGHGSVPSARNANMIMVEALQRLNRKPRRLQLSSASRIMFTEMGMHETGLTGLALRNIGFFKPLAGSSLRKEPVIHALLSNTITLTRISNPPGGHNQVPQEVEAMLDCRLLPETDTEDFIRELRKILANEDIEVEILEETLRARDSRPDVFYRMLEKAILRHHPGAGVAPILFPATNDNNYFRSRGIAAFGILPTHLSRELIASIHAYDERITIRDLQRGEAIYRDFLVQVFSSVLDPAQLTQTLRGRLVDQSLNIPLADGMIVLSNERGVVQATRSGLTGQFRLDSLPVGRYSVKVFLEGYEDITLPDVMIQTGWEQVLRIGLEESIRRGPLRSVERRMRPQNEMATVSARPFDAEEAGRYPGSRDDPARMVSAFAGMRGADDSRNDLIIRGNAPNGLIWRLEDIDIPNPNHFAIPGTSGGGVNILNNKLLGVSDFYSGAFPAEYGNALAGVFDLQLRNGNDQRHEFGFQTGSLFTEATAQGPIGKPGRSSYLMSYRHSSLGLLNDFGSSGEKGLDYSRLFGVDAIPHFQDLAFKTHFPLKQGALTIFGVGGVSRIGFREDRRQNCSFSYRDFGQDVWFGSQMGVGGVRYERAFRQTTALKVSLYSTYQAMNSDRIRVLRDPADNEIIGTEQAYWNRFREQRLGASVRVNHRLSARNDLRLGLVTERMLLNYRDTLEGRAVTGNRDFTGLVRAFGQWRHRFSNSLSVSSGLHGLFFSLNRTWTVDPRLGINWQVTPRRSLQFGAGLHSQIQPLYLYYQQGPNGLPLNRSMGFSHSQHYNLGYTNAVTPRLQFRVEAYFQNLTNIPVERLSSSWSMLNQGLDFKLSFPGALKNEGTGQNYGVEFSLERLFHAGYYYLLTATIYDSRYSGSDGVRRHTDYNGHYTLNAVGGKEWNFSNGHTLGIGLRGTLAGGRRYSPIDLEASSMARQTVIVDTAAYSLQFRDYFRTDLQITYRVQRKSMSHEFGLDLLNIVPVGLGRSGDDLPAACFFFPFSTRNILTTNFNPITQDIATEYQLGFLPIAYYRIRF